MEASVDGLSSSSAAMSVKPSMATFYEHMMNMNMSMKMAANKYDEQKHIYSR